jgi:hypothetical protein
MMSATFSKEKMDEIRRFNWRNFKSEELKRGFLRAISLLGDSGISDPVKLLNWKKTKSDMNRIFSTAKIKLNDSAMIPLEPNISEIFLKNRDYDHLANVWKMWRDSSGKNYSKLYPEFIKLSNEATKEYGMHVLFAMFLNVYFKTGFYSMDIKDLKIMVNSLAQVSRMQIYQKI